MACFSTGPKGSPPHSKAFPRMALVVALELNDIKATWPAVLKVVDGLKESANKSNQKPTPLGVMSKDLCQRLLNSMVLGVAVLAENLKLIKPVLPRLSAFDVLGMVNVEGFGLRATLFAGPVLAVELEEAQLLPARVLKKCLVWSHGESPVSDGLLW